MNAGVNEAPNTYEEHHWLSGRSSSMIKLLLKGTEEQECLPYNFTASAVAANVVIMCEKLPRSAGKSDLRAAVFSGKNQAHAKAKS